MIMFWNNLQFLVAYEIIISSFMIFCMVDFYSPIETHLIIIIIFFQFKRQVVQCFKFDLLDAKNWTNVSQQGSSVIII